VSGGVERANRKAKGRDVWALSWDKGFANWTYVDDTGVQEIGMRIGFADGQEVSDGNVVIQLGAGVDRMFSQSYSDRSSRLRTTAGRRLLDALLRRYYLVSITTVLSTTLLVPSASIELSELHLVSRRTTNTISP
jgi:hypothetical protein